MNPEKSLQLARRFIELPLDKRRLFLETLAREGIDFSQFPIPADVAAEDRLAPSYAQQRMWVLWQLDPQGGAYNLPGAVRLKGALDEAALQQAFECLLERHQSLACVFQQQPDERLHQIHRPAPPQIQHLDLRTLSEAAREARVQAEVEAESLCPFDLEHGPLLRIRLLQLAEQEHVLLLTLHHIVSDGWSMNVLIDEFSRCYDAFAAGAQPQLPALPIQYVDYALWQRRWLEAGELERQLAYWQATLGDEQPVLELPLDRPRPASPSFSGERLELQVDSDLAQQLRSFAARHNLTLFMLLLGAFGLLLQRYTGQSDLRIGSPVANRNRADIEGLIGLFVNTQVLRLQPDAQRDALSYLQAVRQTVLGAQAHQDLPFERLVDALKVERNLSHAPLFQVMYNHQPQVADLSAVTLASGLELSALAWRSRTTQFDLSLDTYEQGGVLRAAFTYAVDLFDAATVERMAEHWFTLLRELVADAARPLWQLPMLDPASLHTQLHEWNATATGYPLHQGVHQMFEAQAQRTPQAPALRFGDSTLSYAELDERANRLAHYLRGQGVATDTLVGVSAQRSVEMVVALLAILKAGGAYVPLDPEYPEERLAYMIEDSGIRLLLTQQALLGSLPLPAGVQCVALDTLTLDDQPANSPALALEPAQLAYVIYTSGSTGRPKGAGNSHQALTNRLCWMQQAYGLDASDTVLQKTPFSFDVSVWEFFWPLMTGACLAVAAPGEHRDPQRLIASIQRHGVTTLHFVPSMLQAFIHEPGVEACRTLTRIVCSGEALPVDAQRQVFARLPGAGLYNLYGPTEAAIDVTHWTCVEEGKDSVPIGQPIANIRTYVLDAGLQPVAPGVSGELYLGGIGLARGYHRRPGLTAERFVADPFGEGGRLYRTGDRVRQRADGVIEYLGRFDHQVKIRGLRIELGEIEARLAEHECVRECVVLALDGRQLVAYLVLNAQPEGWQASLKDWLLQTLPEFMVPSHLMALDSLPLTPNGKLDRKALPQPEATAQSAYMAPESDAERQLAQIWSEVLGVAQVGLDDNFFTLGGDSIIAIQVVSRARQAGLALNPRDLFQHQTLRTLAQAAGTVSSVQIDQRPAEGLALLTPVQRQFFETPMPQRHHWNQALLLVPRQPLQAEQLEHALAQVVAQHDALRLRFTQADGQWQQAHAPQAAPVLWQRQAASDEALAAVCDEAQRSLSLDQGPLLAAVLVAMADGSQRLLLVIHHLVVDGVSWRILLEDLQQACLGQPLPARTSSYQAWAERLAGHADACMAQLEHWQAVGLGAELPRDRAVTQTRVADEHKVSVSFPPSLTQALLQQAPSAYRTQVNDLLLAALARALCDWSGQRQVLVQLEGHGREALFEDIDLTRTVGWFTSLYPVALRPETEPGACIAAVKEQLRAVPARGLGYGVLRYLGPAAVREQLARLPQPRVTFNYLGQFDSQFDAGALWQPDLQGAGQGQDGDAPLANWLSVEGQVYQGELGISFGFSQAMYDTTTIEALAADFAHQLRTLVEHCVQPGVASATPSDFPLSGLDSTGLAALELNLGEVEDILPLSPLQQGLLFHCLHVAEAGDYINQLRLDIDGLEPQRFVAAWQAALDAHPGLRASFHWPDGAQQPLQVIHRQLQLPFTQHDWRDDSAHEARLQALAEQQRLALSATDRAPLLGIALVRLGEQRWHLIYTHHHLLLDGWSHAQLLAEVMQRYRGQLPRQAVAHPRTYLAWLQARDQQLDQQFWQTQLQGLQAPSLLARQRRRVESAGQGLWQQRLSAEASVQIKASARARKVTVNTLVQAAWLLLLQRHCRQDVVCLGASVAGRPAQLPGIEAQLGLFINTVPVVAAPRLEQRLDDWLAQLQASNLAIREHEYTPLADIQRWAGRAGEALFDTLLAFENYPVTEVLQAAGDGPRFGVPESHEQPHYALTLSVGMGDALQVDYRFRHDAFAPADVQRLAVQFAHLLQAIATPGNPCLGELGLLDAGARLRCQQQWQAAEAPVATLAVHQQIEAQAARNPRATALIAEDGTLDYGQLNGLANAWAQQLIARGIGPDDLVGLCSERGLAMVVGLLAILKAGAGYVPLDPQYPRQRLQDILDDSAVKLVLATRAAAQPLQLTASDWLWLDQPQAPLADNPAPRASADNLLALIYTSGSTGRPKGVALSHGVIAAHLQTMAEQYQVTAQDRFVHFASINFDWGTEQWLLPLSQGACCILRGDQIWTAAQAFEVIERERANVVYFPTQYACQLAEWARQEGRQLPVRCLNVAGEALPREGFERLQAHVRPQRIVNGYGPTETVITPLLWQADGDTRIDTGYAPIGTPVPGRSAYLLDPALQLLDAGNAGELYIGGPCLARGYFGQAALTAERFVPDPFDPVGGGRLYRSGDLVRQQANGELEFLGRLDHQVKIRGFRVEPGEIEACLLARTDVREAVVMPRGQGADLHLAAWLVPTEDRANDSGLRQRILDDLRASLPAYMVPARLQLLDRLPLNPNGKVDRKALPEISDESAAAFSAPVDALEQEVAQAWAEVLGMAEVGRFEHFFEAGGHSLLATQVVARLHRAGHTGIGVRELFSHPRLCDFADCLRQAQPAAVTGPQLRAQGDKVSAPLSLAQRRLWIAEQFSQGSGAYGMPLALRLAGPLQVECLHQALQALVQRHEVLRSAVDCDDEGEPLLLIRSAVSIALPCEDLSRLGAAEQQLHVLEAQLANVRQAIPLDQAPMLRAGLLRLSGEAHVLLLNMHHIISDGWSMALMVNELIASYSAFAQDQAPALAPLPLQYSDYALWQAECERAGLLQAPAQWWRTALHGSSGRLALPTDLPRPAQASQAGENLNFDLPQATVERVRARAAQLGVTPYMLLLAAFQLLMHRVSGQHDLLLGADVAGREHPDLEALIGFFVNVLPLRSQLDEQLDFAAWLGRTRTTLLDASAQQALPFDLIVEAAATPRHPGMNPLVQVLFVMNDMPLSHSDLADLQVQVLPQAGGYSKFDMALFIDPVAAGWRVTWQYATELFKAERIQALLRGWLDILDQVLGNPHIQLREITMSVHSEIVAAPAAGSALPRKDKLGSFLKRGAAAPAAKPASGVREQAMVPGQAFPLLVEPVDPGISLTDWVVANRAEVERKLVSHGGLLFRGFGLQTPQDFEAFAEAVQPGLYGQYGDLPKKEGGKNTYRSTPYPEQKMILFHNESAHQDRWPRKQLFFCELPSPVGGATPVVDCRLMYQRLPEGLRQRFEDKGLLYVRTFTDKLDVSWQHFFKTESRAEVERRCQASGIQWRWLDNDELQIRTPCPAVIEHPVSGQKSFFNQVQLHHVFCLDADVREDLLALYGLERMPRHVYYGDGSPIEDADMALIGELYEACAVRFDWQAGDVILLDNMLAAHARDPFQGPRKIVVAMGDMMTRDDLEAFTLNRSGVQA
ncbi:amino acid adenylation domain-containing protein [Pseudomonas sp. NPDC089396]|uniref:amino acid adenylation domain-containing protein n=1 Tax=Pseudomonas sp. NPDC089396 TaxID=3364461 RepID=UPI0038329832